MYPSWTREYEHAYRLRDIERHKAVRRARYLRNREVILEKKRLDRLARLGEYKARDFKRYWENVEYNKVRSLRWQKDNPGRKAAINKRRELAKIQRTPKWLTEQQHEQIVAIYEEAAQLKVMYSTELHVDHIVPLQGKNVSGLHVPWNLQILPASENLSKNNKFNQEN